MCGITGIFDTRSHRAIDRAVLQRMNDSQFHRGPDEGSLHIDAQTQLPDDLLLLTDKMRCPSNAACRCSTMNWSSWQRPFRHP